MSERHLLKSYLRESRILKRDYPDYYRPLQLFLSYPAWRRSLKDDANPLDDQRPWITFSAARFLDLFLKPEMKVFEYGSGGSTLYLAKRVDHVTSVEHNEDWLKRVKKAMEANGLENWTFHLIPPEDIDHQRKQDPSDADSYLSSDKTTIGKSFRRYVTIINDFPEGHFDLVFIDGRARPSCFKHAIGKVKTGGCILWDNTDRTHYHEAMDLAPTGYRIVDFPGPIPYIPNFIRTTGWIVENTNMVERKDSK